MDLTTHIQRSMLAPAGLWTPLTLGALHLVVALLLVPIVCAWARHPGRRRVALSAVLSVAAVAVVYLSRVRPSDIPIEWITVLHEGLGYKTILHLYTRGVHAGVNFAYVLGCIARGPTANLHEVVWLNVFLAFVNAVIFAHVAVRIAGVTWGIVWTLVFALNPATLLAAFSELPTNVLALYFFVGLIAWLVLTDPLPQPRLLRAAGYAVCAIVTLLVSLTRPELGSIGLTALGLETMHWLVPAGTWDAGVERLQAVAQRTVAFLADHLFVTAVLCATGTIISKIGLPVLLGRQEFAGLYPLNPSAVSLFAFLPMLLLPVGVALAIFFGYLHAARHFRRFGGLALSLFFLIRMYFAAQNQYYEMGRYLTYVFPALFLLGLYGWPQFNALARAWQPNWARAARILYVMAWFMRPLPGVPDFYLRPQFYPDGGLAQFLPDLNLQHEVREMLRLTEQSPECVFVGRVVMNYGQPEEAPQYGFALFGGPIAMPVFVDEHEAPLGDVIARAAPNATCVRLYLGGDCNLVRSDGCSDFVAGHRLIEEQRFGSRPYNNSFDYGTQKSEMVIAEYAWP